MHQMSRTTTIILTIACAALLVPGCSHFKKKDKGVNEPSLEWIQDLRKGVAENISDPDKTTKMLSLLDKLELELNKMDGYVRAYYETLFSTDADYGATRDEFQRIVDDFNTKIMTMRGTMIDIQFEMRALATREEWKALSDLDKALMESWQRPPRL